MSPRSERYHHPPAEEIGGKRPLVKGSSYADREAGKLRSIIEYLDTL